MTKAVTLAPAGAGIPWLERTVLRYFVLPRQHRLPWDVLTADFLSATGQVAQTARGMDAGAFLTPVLVRRLRGMEDSSRYWSVAHTMEHMMTVSDSAVRVARGLAQGRTQGITIDVAAAKPAGRFDAMGRDVFVDAFVRRAQEAVAYLEPLRDHVQEHVSLAHPWFGALPVKGWLGLMVWHQHLHLRQVRAIVSGLR